MTSIHASAPVAMPANDGAFSDRPVIFISLRDFSTVRNILPEKTVERLVQADVTFVVLCPDPKHPFLIDYLGKYPNFILEQLDVDALTKASRSAGNRLKEWFRIVRFLTYGNSTLEMMGTRRGHIEVYKNESVSGASSLLGRLYHGSVVPFALIASRSKILRRMIVAIEKQLYPFSAHTDLYRRYNPSWLVVPSLGYSQDPYLMREASSHGAKNLSIIRSWDNTTNKGYGGHYADRAFTWHELMSREVVQFHDLPASRVEAIGAPHWDGYFKDIPVRDRDQFLLDHGLRPDRKTIYFAMGVPKNFHHNFAVIKMLLKAIRDGKFCRPVQLLVRLHPGYSLKYRQWESTERELNEELPQLIEDNRDIMGVSDQIHDMIGDVPILMPENQINLKEVFMHSDVMVNIYSTQMIEAAIFDLPTLMIGWLPMRQTDLPMSAMEGFNHVHRIMETGGVRSCHSEEEFLEQINADLEQPERFSKGRKKICDQEAGSNRGRASEVLAQRLIELAEFTKNTSEETLS